MLQTSVQQSQSEKPEGSPHHSLAGARATADNCPGGSNTRNNQFKGLLSALQRQQQEGGPHRQTREHLIHKEVLEENDCP